ncbi:DUF2778 domain-containing protein [Methylopila sp. M107]|uniref:DUF2778 domain-containing protein n=1 Tax=Methylopila sp. M107 TaxID=1101190 RepID=UPI0003A83AAF|nr:DUF2778 domain-containing protein [Methylopila sp. M107]
MSTCVRVSRRRHWAGPVGLFFALTLAGGAVFAALLTAASVATENLVVAMSHRPDAVDGPHEARRIAHPSPRRDVVASLYADRDLLDGLFHDAEAGRRDDAALGARLADASSPAGRTRSAAQRMSQPPAKQPEQCEAKLEAAPRVISANAPVQLAALTPATRPVPVAETETPVAGPVAEVDRAAAPAVASIAEPIRIVPIPKPRPADFARMASAPARVPVRLETAAPEAPAVRVARSAALAYAAPELETKSEGPSDFFRKLLDQDSPIQLPQRRSGVAVYDIASATVRLPNGERLEAHSGLGHRQDNPAYVREKNHGPTPPNVYDLRMREALFHGAAAIRLLPRDQKKVFNRDGLLAHPYMYVGGGSRSQSNGCVVFKDYARFLRAFKAGEIARLVVVPNMAELGTYMAGL